MSPKAALGQVSWPLTEFETKELLRFPRVYFIPKRQFVQNEQYDDASGFYKLFLGDHIVYRYEIQSVLGSGTFGYVCKCFDHKNQEDVAIKIIKNKPEYHAQALVEIRILEDLRVQGSHKSKNFVKVKNYFIFRSHVCIVFELLGANLDQVIRKHPRLKLDSIRTILRQLLSALKRMQKLKLIHCDLKPANIMFTPSMRTAKLIDFGLSCYVNSRVYTYVQSRFYRAPEIVLGVPYTEAIDMWSLGCVLAELYLAEPLFPSRSQAGLFKQMVQLLGAPPRKLLMNAKNKTATDYAEGSSGEMYCGNYSLLRERIGSNDAEFLDFLEGCLRWDPMSRLTPKLALRHSFLANK